MGWGVQLMPVGRWALGLCLIVLLAGCGLNSGPDTSSVRQILQDQLDPSGKVIVVQSIDHLNAVKPENPQNPRWTVDVTATLRFQQSAAGVAATLQNADSVPNFLSTAGQIGLMLQFGNFKAGETQTYRTRLELLKGSSGWMPAK